MNHNPYRACSLFCLVALLPGCATGPNGSRWSYSKQPDSAKIVVSRISPGDCLVAVNGIDGKDAVFTSSYRDVSPPVNLNEVDWPLYLPPGAHELALGLAWNEAAGNFRYTPMNTDGRFYYDHYWSDGVRSQGKVTAIFKSGHSYRLYAFHKKDFEVILWDITADPKNPTVVQTWVVPGATASARAGESGSKHTTSN
jgi:hypothetical protein